MVVVSMTRIVVVVNCKGGMRVLDGAKSSNSKRSLAGDLTDFSQVCAKCSAHALHHGFA
jgi:hypothetical protein